MVTRNEAGKQFIDISQKRAEEVMHGKAYQVTNRLVEVAVGLELPTVRTLAPTEDEIRHAPRIPLVGGGEMRIWKRLYSEETWVIVKMVIDSSTGGVKEDLLQLSLKNRWVIPETSSEVGLKYLAQFDPNRDIDKSHLDGSNLQNEIIQGLGYTG